jgi:hypothetical protein
MEGSWARWSIIRERPEGPRALAMRDRRSTAAGVIGKEYRS